MHTFRFIHTADIHLDSPLRGLVGQEGDVTERIRLATRQAFEQLITLAIQEEVDFLVIAGDLYDGDWRDYHTGLFFVRQMGRLAERGIHVFLLYGNHDAESQLTRRLLLPGNVHVFSARKAETLMLDDPGVALHGHSYRVRGVEHDLVPGYPPPVSGMFNIGVLHTALEDPGAHADYAPCTLDELVHKGYDYWALGHVHTGAILHRHPQVVFPGNLQARHINEAGVKSACLVSVEEGDVADVSLVATDVVRWQRLVVDTSDLERVDDVVGRMVRTLETAVEDQADGRLLACRMLLQGRCPVHDLLLASQERLLAEARAAALGLGDEAAWIERLVVDTRPTSDAREDAQRQDALGELQRLLPHARADADLLQVLQEDLQDLVRKLPHEIRTHTEDAALRCAVEGDYAALVDQLSGYLTARLMTEDH